MAEDSVKPNDYLLLLPSGGLPKPTTEQKPALDVPAVGGPADGDLPNIPGVSGFGEGPDVIKPYTCTGSPGYEGMPGAA